MKKNISIIFLILANIILLLHTIVPHHHHDGVVVTLINGDCNYITEDICSQPCNSKQNDHQHKHSRHSDGCVLDKDYTIFDTNTKLFNTISLLFNYIIDNNTKLIFNNSTYLTFHLKPLIHSSYIIEYYGSFGLRAPPFISLF